MRMKPGRPPRCETSTPPPGVPAAAALAMNSVSEAAIRAWAASSRRASVCAAWGCSPPSGNLVRAWMYLAQLPKLCATETAKPLSSTVSIRPLARLRRRVSNSRPSRPIGAVGLDGVECRIVGLRRRRDGEAGRVGARGEAYRPGQRRRQGPAIPVENAREQPGQLAEEDAVLVRHEAADAGAACGDARPCLRGELAGVKGSVRQHRRRAPREGARAGWA